MSDWIPPIRSVCSCNKKYDRIMLRTLEYENVVHIVSNINSDVLTFKGLRTDEKVCEVYGVTDMDLQEQTTGKGEKFTAKRLGLVNRYLKRVDYIDNRIVSEVNFHGNFIEGRVEIPEGIEWVNCSHNLYIEELILSEGVRRVNCRNNRIQRIVLPSTLYSMKCDRNVTLENLEQQMEKFDDFQLEMGGPH